MWFDLTTIRLNDKTKMRLLKLKGKLESQDGKRRDFEDVINELIDRMEKNV
jgi:hypothetical protein